MPKAGTRASLGYGLRHQKIRRRWALRVQTGVVKCARCGNLIVPGTPWDLGHTDDRTGYNGPEHAYCNRAAAGGAKDRHSRAW